MTDTKWRQAITAYLTRMPKSETTQVTQIAKALGWDGKTPGHQDLIWSAVYAELRQMGEEGLITWTHNGGWKLKLRNVDA